MHNPSYQAEKSSKAGWLHSEAGWLHGEAGWLHSEAGWLHSEAGWLHSEAGWLHYQNISEVHDGLAWYDGLYMFILLSYV